MRTTRVTLVHDYLLVLRGAERTFGAMADIWPAAPVSTLLYDPDATEGRFAAHPVTTSSLQRLRVRQGGFRALLPVFPLAAQRLELAPSDVVVSSSSAFAHGVRPAPGTPHLCYCHSPFRYAWHERERGLAEAPAPLRPALDRVLDGVRRWDRAASERVTRYLANSAITQRRIAEAYGRESVVVHPPVEVERFVPGEHEGEFLFVGELVAHKQVELALEAVRRADARVTVVGDGPDRERLEALHGDHARFLGRLPDAELATRYTQAQALLVPGVEEFGIAAVEAQAAGRPVVAADAGGVQETVRDGETGVLVPPGDVDAFAQALRDTDFVRFDSAVARANAERFSTASFQRRLAAEVDRLVAGDL